MSVDRIRASFTQPSEEYSPIPFWFWNDYLDEDEIYRQMSEFKSKGVDGFVIHPRIGLPKEIEYLSDTYFHYVKYAVQKAKEMNMKVFLYDEAMYPSGSCHGKVVAENPNFASKGLEMRVSPDIKEGEELIYQLERDGEEFYFIQGYTGGTIRGIHYGEDDREANAPKSTDLLNPKAVECFIRLTHEKYYEELKEYFGDTILAMFTDEPDITGRNSKRGMISWTDGFFDEFIECGGEPKDLYLLFEGTNTEERARAKEIYNKAIHKRMSAAYYKQIADWCEAHKVAMTGHPGKSTDIGYLKYFTIPCQDIVWRFVTPEQSISGEHSTMGKCSSDSARHRGRRRNGNECFGCCGSPEDPYRFTKDDMKWYLDWLFVRGVNLIIPHAFYYSLRDRRKEERPPEVGMHSEFWNEYNTLSGYMKRMCYLLTDSVNQTEIALLCDAEHLSWKMAKPLFENQIEFNYLEEELLCECKIVNGRLEIGSQSYSILVVDRDLDEAYANILQEFEQAGGKVLRFHEDTIVSDIEKHCTSDICVSPYSKDLRQTHIIKDNTEFFILTNEGEEKIETKLSFPNSHVYEIWDAYENTTKELPQPVNSIDLNLERRSSIILVVKK